MPFSLPGFRCLVLALTALPRAGGERLTEDAASSSEDLLGLLRASHDAGGAAGAKCTEARVNADRRAFERLGAMAPSDFAPPGSSDWARPLDEREHRVWSDFRISWLPAGAGLQASGAVPAFEDVAAPQEAPACPAASYGGAACLAGLDVDVGSLSSPEALKAFQAGLGDGLTRFAFAGSASVDQQDGAEDTADVSAVGFGQVKQALDACQDGCGALVMTPAIQSLVYAHREWRNHQGKLVPQLLVSSGTRMLWLDFRTLQDFVAIAGDLDLWGLFMLRGGAPSDRRCPEIPAACANVVAPWGLPDGLEESCQKWAAWRTRAAAPAPTDYLAAKLNLDLLKTHQPQKGPVCAAQSVANVLNGMLGGLYVKALDVLEFYSAKEKGDVFGDARPIRKKSGDGFSTAKVGSANIKHALRNVAKKGNALAWMVKEKAERGKVAVTVVKKPWFSKALKTRRVKDILGPSAKTNLSSGTLMSKKSGKVKTVSGFALAKDAGPDTIRKEWATLTCWLDHCAGGHCGVIFHLTNHYAPIYGYREFGGHRQLLVPSSGQSPSAWQDYLSARETMTSWKGYNMVVGYIGARPKC